MQAEIRTDRGTFRVDLYIREHAVVIEADGKLKYTADDALWREKRRQDALERAGCRIVRITWDEVTRRPDEVLARVLHACAAAARVH